jgi:hypothetical protein
MTASRSPSSGRANPFIRPGRVFLLPLRPFFFSHIFLLASAAFRYIPYTNTHTTKKYHTSRITMASATTFYDLKPLDSKGQDYDFNELKGKVVLIVNVASK